MSETDELTAENVELLRFVAACCEDDNLSIANELVDDPEGVTIIRDIKALADKLERLRARAPH
jgi:hypothetical protein